MKSNRVTAGRTGFVYVMTNQSMPGLVKVGFTTRPPSLRAQELSAATGVPGSFVVEYYAEHADARMQEGYFHDDNAQFRVDGSEFFSMSLEAAIDYMENGLCPAISRSFATKPTARAITLSQEEEDAFDDMMEEFFAARDKQAAH